MISFNSKTINDVNEFLLKILNNDLNIVLLFLIFKLTIYSCNLCDECDLMVDPLKLFWVITNSTYLGTF